MGLKFFDRWSLSHFAFGILAYYFYLPFLIWILIHVIFEIVENTTIGIFIRRSLTFLPGSEKNADSFINSFVGDNFFAILGWIVAYYISG